LLNVSYVERTESCYPLTLFSHGYEYRILGLFPVTRHLAIATGARLYVLGTDGLGRDVFARALSGARSSLLVVITGVAVYAIFGLVIGIIAALAGGWLDSALMRLSEFVLALPALYVILALRAVLPAKLAYWQAVILTSGTIA